MDPAKGSFAVKFSAVENLNRLPTIERALLSGIMADTHPGKCYCGAVAIEVTGMPEGMGYCHCSACRSYIGAPINAFTLWKPNKVKITKGEDSLGRFRSSEMSVRRFCTNCGGNVMTEHPGLGLIDVFAGVIPSMPFKAGVHLNYEEAVLPIKDGLPKMRDFPAEIGGSGETMSE
jgi:hypothetical protein